MTSYTRGQTLTAEQLNADFAGRIVRAGDTMTGPLTLFRDPLSNLEAATRQYVDASAGAYTSIPQMYGAVGDGVADDTDAILAAVAAVPASGGVVHFPRGIYKLSQTILLPASTRIVGDGPGASTIIMANATNLNPMIANASLGLANNGVSNITIDGNKSHNGAGTSQGIFFTQTSQVTVENVEIANFSGPSGLTISGNGVNTTRGAFVQRVYIHNCDLFGLQVTFASRQTVINGVLLRANGTVGNPTWAAAFLDASEMVVTNLIADANISNGIHIHNVFGCSYNNLVATRNGRHGIFAEMLTSSMGSGWRSQNNGTQTANTYDDIHFGSANTGGSYGTTQNSLVATLTVGSEANLGTPAERYGLYIEDGVNTNVHIHTVHYTGASSTGNSRLPGVMGTLVVD